MLLKAGTKLLYFNKQKQRSHDQIKHFRFKKSINYVKKSCSVNSTLPILHNVLFETKDELYVLFKRGRMIKELNITDVVNNLDDNIHSYFEDLTLTEEIVDNIKARIILKLQRLNLFIKAINNFPEMEMFIEWREVEYFTIGLPFENMILYTFVYIKLKEDHAQRSV